MRALLSGTKVPTTKPVETRHGASLLLDKELEGIVLVREGVYCDRAFG
ncbi:hypothetical protein MC7420_6574 [Coleofasciculus chthonoplastes PCC 7420]|uniref:Uncharacterized protein n=1 Tax=Coleofasciculus chthonoplastes PCC 7420 TaxID=118168 RepID=B4W5A8_9CYAN|nr:hypothetical protein MC7420_6574 [Coleofasciculus chthonoplastes PCC 7420]